MTGFDTTPDPKFLRAMQNQKWTVAGALSELVDNSFGPGRGNAKNVHILHDPHRRVIIVRDDGQGMQAIGRLFQLGNTIGRAPGDIGNYGSGGTMALLWLSRKVAVLTLRDGKISHDELSWSDEIKAGRFPIVSDDWETATRANTPEALYETEHGTYIVLFLANERRFQTSNVKRDLARTYAPALRHGKTISWVTVGRDDYWQPINETQEFPDPLRVIHFTDLLIEIDGETLFANGEIRVIPDLPLEQSKISIGFGPRVILKTRDCYNSPDGAEHYSGVGVTGWLDLSDGWQPYLSTTKDAINDQRVWDALMSYIFEKIRTLLKQVERERMSVVLDDIALTLEQILDGTAHVDLPSERGEKSGRNNSRDGDNDSGDIGDESSADKGSDVDGNDANRDKQAATQIIVIPLTDRELNQTLCKAELSADGAVVYVNEEHDFVKKALVSRPINRELLALLIVQGIGGALADNELLARKVFPPKAIKQLEDRKGRDREGLIMRMLMDRVRKEAA
jgi:hypothetical protein